MRKIAVLGAKGMLGHELLKSFNGVHQVIALDIEELDVFDLDATIGTLKTINPDLVIHSAAYTDVDGCELDPDKAHQVNALGSRNVAIGCQKIDAAMVYISTDYVFSGQKSGSYQEWDPTGPINVYGTSKLSGENLVRGLCLRHYVVRTSWLYGRHGKNFVDTIARLARERDSLRVVVDQTGSPTWAHDLADKIAELVRKEAYGTYHITNSDTCTWFDFASEIVARLGLDTRVEPVTSEQYTRPAKRPANSVLDNYYLRLEGFSPMRSYRQALSEYLTS
jgi:dTDP-4-dehydrorhamnose reductase